MTRPDEEDFLSRWSRRKHEARQEREHESLARDVPAGDTDAGQLTDADMPPLETLTEDSDYSVFFSPKVSEALRKQALRKLFQSPVFNLRDGLDDYDDDFTKFEKLGDIMTADLKHQLEVQAQRLQQLAEDDTSIAEADQQAQEMVEDVSDVMKRDEEEQA